MFLERPLTVAALIETLKALDPTMRISAAVITQADIEAERDVTSEDPKNTPLFTAEEVQKSLDQLDKRIPFAVRDVVVATEEEILGV